MARGGAGFDFWVEFYDEYDAEWFWEHLESLGFRTWTDDDMLFVSWCVSLTGAQG